MDAVISIGGQSFLDGVIRLLGPALQALRAPMPVAFPGLTNGLLTIRNIVPVLPGGTPSQIELRVDFEISGEALLVASVAAGTVNLNLGNANINFPRQAGTVGQPLRGGQVRTPAQSVTATGVSLTLPAVTSPLDLDAAADAVLSLDPIVATFNLPAAVGNLALPLPAVTPVALDLTRGTPLTAAIFLLIDVNGLFPDAGDAPINASTGFGLDFGFRVISVQPPAIAGTLATTLRDALTAAVRNVATQLLRGLTPIVQPTLDLQAIATDIAGRIPAIVQSVLTDAFTGLRARTGRLMFPPPGAGIPAPPPGAPPPPPGPPTSCEVLALPTDAKARLIVSGGSIVLQVGFHRTAIHPSDRFLPFTPTGLIDTRVELSNGFVQRLLGCLLERMPNLTLLPPAPTRSNVGTTFSLRWSSVTLNLGPFALKGTLDLIIAGPRAGPGLPPIPKAISLVFNLDESIGWAGPALDIRVNFSLPISFDLNSVASITSLRLAGVPSMLTFNFQAGSALIALLVIGAALMTVLPGVKILGLALLVVTIPFIVIQIISRLLSNTIDTVLAGARLLESPAALPPGILEAFGKLVPTTMVVDDLVAHGVLQTPTSPWSLLPIFNQAKPVTTPPSTPDTPRTPVGPPTTTTTNTTANDLF